MVNKRKIQFDKDEIIKDRFLEKMEDSGYGNLTQFYGTRSSEKKIIKKLNLRLKKW